MKKVIILLMGIINFLFYLNLFSQITYVNSNYFPPKNHLNAPITVLNKNLHY